MRKLILIILLTCPVGLNAKITQDSVGQSAFVSAASVTWGHILGSCAHSVLIAICGNDASTITSIKYAGIPLTSRVALTSTETMQIWTLSNSTTIGSANLVATFGGSVNGICASVSLCGVYDLTPVDASATAQATTANPTSTATVVSSGSWMVDGGFNNATTLAPCTTNKNIVSSLFNNGGPSTFFSQFGGPFQAGSNTLSWQQPTSAAWTKALLSIRPSTGTPILTTQNVTNIGANSATGNGIVLSSGSFAITAQGICINTAGLPTTSDTCVSATGSPFTASLTGLLSNTAYHTRSYATNSIGTDYGDDIQFVTLAPKGIFATPGNGNTRATPGSGNISIR